ncbi:MAG: polyphosphate kinase 2 family protein [Chloroflexota bacterium]|nr:polyphosphate kinase 2 family protein [Chloroflexota bacterium]
MPIATIFDRPTPLDLGSVSTTGDESLTEDDAGWEFAALTTELRDLQELMYAASTNALLVVLQGMDASGKDVTIGNVFSAANPQAAQVFSFSKRSEEDEAHHLLWRASTETPALGELTVFDRSYYEVPIIALVDRATENDDVEDDSGNDDPGERGAAGDRDPGDDPVERDLAHIRNFERLLTDHGTIVVKVFLHVSAGEQGRRLTERQENPETAWKISARDWQARRRWPAYMAAYGHVIAATATPEAPWWVVPADRQWFHDLAVARLLADRLRPYRRSWEEARERLGEEKAAEAREEQRRGDAPGDDV